jgi:hypothetical protein
MIKSRRMKWTRHVPFMGEVRNTYKALVRKLMGRDHSADLHIDGNITLKR